MPALVHLLLVGGLAWQLQSRVALLADFRGLPRYLLSLGLTLFLVNWTDFTLYVLLGWGEAYTWLSWGVLLGAVGFFASRPRPPTAEPLRTAIAGLLAFRRWNFAFLFLAVLIVSRFWTGLVVDREGTVWCNFNFVDTAFHLSVANAFLAAPHFPPLDLDMTPFPLKYHFVADFYVAHLVHLGLPLLKSIWLLNVVSAAAMVGAIWAAFERWLALPARWVLLAALLFLCLNPALVNLVHYLALHPAFFNPADPFDGLLRFPYFNFEYAITNLLEPQRGLVFSLPVALLVLHGAFGVAAAETGGASSARTRRVTLESFWLVCLLPLAHIVAFAVLALSLAPKIWAQRAWFFAAFLRWAPVFIVGLLQLSYLLCYGPPGNAAFSGWDVGAALALPEFAPLPAFARRIVFWFFANGDFLGWGALFLGLAAVSRSGGVPAAVDDLTATWTSPLRTFLRAWKWFFAANAALFLLINFYRYSFFWGDSNKFVFFLNLGLSLVIALGAAQWLGRRGEIFSRALWWFFFVLCVAPPAYEFGRWIVVSPHPKIILFQKNTRAAAAWLCANTPPSAVVLTAAFNDTHFVTALAGRPTLAGIYSDSNPYLQDARAEAIRRVYEQADFSSLRELGVSYVCVSGGERLKYTLHPEWARLMAGGRGVRFHAGGGAEDHFSVYIFDAVQLAAP